MLSRFSIAVALAFAPAPLFAQTFVQPIGVGDADRLAEQVRRLGANPRDLDALLSAAELSIRLDDLSAAGSFLARAEKVSPVTPRGLAIKGALLVRAERPGEALRLFAQAETMGVAPARFAADRGLAYDLLGEQRRAQADYRLALRDDAASDEVRRRLSLSLGIAGRAREAQEERAPLVRRNDRAAWRARAFVLAMDGKATEALSIAQTMMPPGSAAGLQGFFAELPRLPAIDRAFAVHFGEVRPSPQRLADARLAPQLTPLPPEPVQIAAVRTTAGVAPVRERGRRAKPKPGRVALPEAAPVQVAAVEALPPPPAYRAPTYQPPLAPTPLRTASVADRPLTPGEQASLAAATLPSARRRVQVRATPVPSLPTATVAVAPPVRTERPVQLATAAPAAKPAVPTSAPARVDRPVQSAVAASASTTTRTPVQLAAATPVQPATIPAQSQSPVQLAATAPAPSAPAPVQLAAAAPPRTAPSPGFDLAGLTAAAPTPSTAATLPAEAASTATEPSVEASPPPAAAVAATPSAARAEPALAVALATPVPGRPARVSRAQADDILAKIVANLSIPASELGIDEPVSGTRASRAAERLAKADAPRAAKTAGSADESAKDRKAAARPDPKAKAAADRKALADRKAAAEKQALADKAAAEKKAARGEPARIWVQVAGGANEGDLAKAWSSVRTKAPGAFAGRQGYTTPLRATNRVLTGPFKTDAEARAYVNQLAKSGVSAFSFRSDPGQKVSKLGGK